MYVDDIDLSLAMHLCYGRLLQNGGLVPEKTTQVSIFYIVFNSI